MWKNATKKHLQTNLDKLDCTSNRSKRVRKGRLKEMVAKRKFKNEN